MPVVQIGGDPVEALRLLKAQKSELESKKSASDLMRDEKGIRAYESAVKQKENEMDQLASGQPMPIVPGFNAYIVNNFVKPVGFV